MPRVRVYCATSLDGFVAGPDDDLSWLPTDDPGPLPEGAVDFASFLGSVGALLMGRRTFDVVHGFGGPWPYGDLPVLVATHRPLPTVPASVQAVAGPLPALLDQALAAAQGRDLYLDGADLTHQALAHDRVDELILTVVPVLLGGGTRLFPQASAQRAFRFGDPVRFGPQLVQLHAQRVR